jgi:hypothetical protein
MGRDEKEVHHSKEGQEHKDRCKTHKQAKKLAKKESLICSKILF